MPRIYTSTNDPVDFHVRCFPSEQAAAQRYGALGDGPDGRGNCFSYDADHPDYADDEHYKCAKCGGTLEGEVR